MRSKLSNPKFVYIATVAILLIVSFLVGILATREQPVIAKDTTISVEQDGDRAYSGTCTIEDISVYENRIHVRCQSDIGGLVSPGVYYFAYSLTTTEKALQANRYLAMLNTAYALGKNPGITWSTDSADNPSGCLINNCRLLTAVVIY